MDTVPQLFIESVCLCLLDLPSLWESTSIPSAWGQICTVTTKKIHTLRVVLDGSAEKIYVAALPALDNDVYYNYVSLNCVDLKFITNFRIETVPHDQVQVLSNSWNEITLDKLQRFVQFIRPVKNERHPLRYHDESLNSLSLWCESQWINGEILSMRLPVDSVDLWKVEADQFFENTGSLYYVNYYGPTLKRSAVRQWLSEEQMKKLFEKCAEANREVRVRVTTISDSTDPIDYDKYYSERKVLEHGTEVLFTNQDKKKLELRLFHSNRLWLEWKWSKERIFS
uniref:FBA_2 domain-containing protein n=1 Tax=Steinernema glaseri TaxID=37863 RepID=A0A1I8ALY9_9BILA